MFDECIYYSDSSYGFNNGNSMGYDVGVVFFFGG